MSDEEKIKRPKYTVKSTKNLTEAEQKELDETDWVCMKCATKHRGLECPRCKEIEEEAGEIIRLKAYIGECAGCKTKNVMVHEVTHLCLSCWWDQEKPKDESDPER